MSGEINVNKFALMGMASGHASNAAKWQANAKEWETYAHKLEQTVIALRKGEAAQIAIKKYALREIEKLDSKNKMLDVAFRKKIYDQAFAQPQTVSGE